MQLSRNHKRKVRIEILPMIDVVFFLLVFFMLFATIEANPTGIDVNLPKAATGSQEPKTSFVITVDQSGTLYVEGRALTPDQLRTSVDKTLKARPDTFVIIKGDKRTDYEYIVKAMDEVRKVGGSKLGLAVERTE